MRDTSIVDLQTLYRRAKTARRRFEKNWYLNLAYFQGDQWLAHDGSRLYRPRLRADRVQLVDNRIQPAVRTEVAKLSKQRPSFRCTPRTSDDSDMNAAELAEKVLEYLWTHLAMQEHLERALLWSRICGAGFVKAAWDPSIGDGTQVLVGPDKRPLLDSSGRPMRPDVIDPAQLSSALGFPEGTVQAKTINVGDIRVAVRSPFQIVPDPLAGSWSEVDWLIEESVVSQDHIADRYGVLLDADTDANPGLIETHLMGSVGASSGFHRGVKLFEYWRKPCRDHPNGFRAVWAGRRILETDERPWDPMPFVMISGIPVPGRLWPTSICEQLIGPQTELNKVKSQIAEHRNRLGNATVVASKSAVGDPDEFQRQLSAPGGIAWVDDTMQNAQPTFLEPPSLPSYILQEIDRCEAAIQDIAGQHEVSSAQVPAGVTAASAINLLQEQDDTRLGPAAWDLERQLAEIGRKELRLVARYYDDRRTISLAGDDQAWEIIDFRGTMLRDHTHVEVAGSMMPRSLAAQQAAMQSMLTMFLQNGVPLKDQNLARFLRDYQVGGLEHLVADFTNDQAQINRENRQLTLGQPLDTNNFDNDQAHVDGHEAYQKSYVYEQLDPGIKAIFERHVDEHRQKLAQAQAAQMQLEQGGAQPAGEPAGAGHAEQQMQVQGAQAQQQLQQSAATHDQRLRQQEEAHQQRMRQQASASRSRT